MKRDLHRLEGLLVLSWLVLLGCGTSKLDEGQRCNRDEDCKTGYCNRGTCDYYEKRHCEAHQDCGGMLCESNLCTPCSSDLQCIGANIGDLCQDTFCVHSVQVEYYDAGTSPDTETTPDTAQSPDGIGSEDMGANGVEDTSTSDGDSHPDEGQPAYEDTGHETSDSTGETQPQDATDSDDSKGTEGSGTSWP